MTMRLSWTRAFVWIALVISVAPARAHHSSAAFDTGQEVVVTGRVTEYVYRNPHVYLTLDVEGTSLEVEAGAASVLSPLGFTRDAVRFGDVVTIAGNPGRRDPDRLMLGRELFTEDGTYYPLNISSESIYEESDQTATGIAGTWFSPRTEFFAFLGGARGWAVTEAGRTAMANTNPMETPQKDCIPIAAPGLMFYPVANTITLGDDQVVMRVDWMDSERVIHLDGRQHPPASETSLHGHSVGQWEGDVLVVETTNYDAHPMGLSTSLPGSTGKRLVERFRLREDGKALVYSGTMEDPEYLAEPVSWEGEWLYRPTMRHSNEQCDIDTARRFLDD